MPAVASQLYAYPITQDKTAVQVFDFGQYSCLNGWSMGNAVVSGRNLAMFFRDVFAPPNSSLPPRLLNATTVAAMQTFVNLTNDWCALNRGPLLRRYPYRNRSFTKTGSGQAQGPRAFERRKNVFVRAGASRAHTGLVSSKRTSTYSGEY